MKKFIVFYLFIASTIPTTSQWTIQNTGFQNTMRGIRNISIVNENIVWALAFDGSGANTNVQEFTKTIDGGLTWSPEVINIASPNSGIANITAVSATTAWVAVYPLAINQAKGIYKTTDGGNTWNRQNTALFNQTNSFPDLVYFFDENNGFCAGDSVNDVFECYITTNGGDNWVAVPDTNLPTTYQGEYINSLSFCTYQDSFWFWSNKGRLFHSTNKGESFQVYSYPITDFYPLYYSLAFNNASLGMVIEGSGLFWLTTDSGQNWTMDFVNSGLVYNGSLAAVPDTTTIFTTGLTGSSYSLNPYETGPSFVIIDNLPHTCVEFVDRNTGWSGGFNTNSTTGGIYKWNGTLSSEYINQSPDIELFPVPVKDVVTIKTKTIINQVVIFNTLGQIVKNVQPHNFTSTIDLTHLPNGTYLVKLKMNNKEVNTKIIK